MDETKNTPPIGELIGIYSEKRRKGMDYTLMRKEMLEKGIEEEKVTNVLRYISYKELNRTNLSDYREKSLSKRKVKLIGSLICGTALIVMVLIANGVPIIPFCIIIIVWGGIIAA